MASERQQRQIDRLLDQAEEAITNEDWATVASRARSVLAIDPGNADGLAYLAASGRILGTSDGLPGEPVPDSQVPYSGAGASTPTPAAADSELPSGMITYLFTDVEGSTPLWQRLPHEMREVMSRHDSILTSAIESNGGAVVRPRNSAGNPDSPQAVVFLTSIIDETVGIATSYMHY